MGGSLPTILVPYAAGSAATPTQIVHAAQGIGQVLFLLADGDSDLRGVPRSTRRRGARNRLGRWHLRSTRRAPAVAAGRGDDVRGTATGTGRPTGRGARPPGQRGSGTPRRPDQVRPAVTARRRGPRRTGLRTSHRRRRVGRSGHPDRLPLCRQAGPGQWLRRHLRAQGRGPVRGTPGDLLAASARSTMVVEQLLQGGTRSVETGWGDYVSVESVSCDGRHQVLGVTGKLPTASCPGARPRGARPVGRRSAEDLFGTGCRGAERCGPPAGTQPCRTQADRYRSSHHRGQLQARRLRRTGPHLGRDVESAARCIHHCPVPRPSRATAGG